MKHGTHSRLEFAKACVRISSFNTFIHDLSIKLTDAQVRAFANKSGVPVPDFRKPAGKASPEELRIVGAASVATGGLASEKLQIQKPYLSQMTFSRSVDNFLSYISDLLFEIFVHRPEALRTREKIDVSIALDFSDREQLVHYLAERKVNELAYKGIIELSEYINTTLGFPLVESEAELEEISRIVQIRNLIIHNRGIVNKQAIHKCPSLGFNAGDEIQLDDAGVIKVYDFLSRTVMSIDEKAIAKFGLTSIMDTRDE